MNKRGDHRPEAQGRRRPNGEAIHPAHGSH
jgi:hypothetical protein